MSTTTMVLAIIAAVSALGLILSVVFQTSKAEGFSAAMGGGGSESRFKPGSREEWLYKLTKVFAIIWILSCLFMAYFWYHGG